MSQFEFDWQRESMRSYSGGFFKSAPLQFYSSNFKYFGKTNTMILPCAYVTMSDKITETYVEVIEAMKLIIKPLGTDFLIAPSVVLTDFEQSVMNALNNVSRKLL